MDFRISYNAFNRALLTILLAGPKRSRVRLDRSGLDVVMGVGGWAFRAKVPRASIHEARRDDGWVWGWGAHGWRGRWLVNGSSRGLVRMRVDPPARARCLFWPIRLRDLRLSLDEPDRFLAEIGG